MSLVDWYEVIDNLETDGDLLEESGCCLLCASAKDECLCYNCKCKQCINYENHIESGFCLIAKEWKQESSKKYQLGNKFSKFIICDIIKETIKAYYCKIKGLNLEKEIWIPKSVVDSSGNIKLWFLWKLGFTKINEIKTKQIFIDKFFLEEKKEDK